jgi:hypothetical protein
MDEPPDGGVTWSEGFLSMRLSAHIASAIPIGLRRGHIGQAGDLACCPSVLRPERFA